MQVAKVSLDPAKVKARKAHVKEPKIRDEPVSPPTADISTPKTPVKQSERPKGDTSCSNGVTKTSSHRVPVVSFVRSSKFRHIEGHLSHRSSTIDKLPALSSTVPGDSNAFQANSERVAVVLSVAGGQVAVLEVRRCMACITRL